MSAEIELYCNEPSHNGKRQIVYRFVLIEEHGYHVWGRGEGRLERGIVGRKIPGIKTAAARLVDDRYVTPAEMKADHTIADQIRTRFELECKICGLNVTVRRETIEPVLDTLAAAAVPDITLRALAARVS